MHCYTEEHAKRYAEAPEPLTSSECSYEKLPTPWRSALANRRVRAEVCAFIAEGFAQRFAARRRTFPNAEAYIIVHGAGKAIKQILSAGLNDMPEHAAATQIGEGHMSVAYWLNQFPQDNVVVRVLDYDEVSNALYTLCTFLTLDYNADSYTNAAGASRGAQCTTVRVAGIGEQD